MEKEILNLNELINEIVLSDSNYKKIKRFEFVINDKEDGFLILFREKETPYIKKNYKNGKFETCRTFGGKIIRRPTVYKRFKTLDECYCFIKGIKFICE